MDKGHRRAATNDQAMPILLLNLLRVRTRKFTNNTTNLSNNKFLVPYESLGVLALRDR